MFEEKIKLLPKVELHCHLDGSLPLVTIQKLLQQEGKSIPASMAEVQTLVSVTDDCQSLVEYLEKFELLVDALQTKEALYQATVDFIESLASDNIMYVEVRFAPLLSTHSQLDCYTVVKNVVDGLKTGQEKYGIRSNAILCAMRHHTQEQNMELIEVAKTFLNKGVCALDLAGDEVGFPVLLHQGLFQKAKQEGIPFTIHAGECGSKQSVQDALDLGAQRIGHGIAIAQDKQLQSECKERKIGIEMCPISNFHTKAARDWASYPFPLFYEEGLMVTINTDNRTVSNTTLMREFTALQDAYNITVDDVKDLTENAIDVAFLSEKDKQLLKKKFRED